MDIGAQSCMETYGKLTHTMAKQLLLDKGANVRNQGGVYGKVLQVVHATCMSKEHKIDVTRLLQVDVNTQRGMVGPYYKRIEPMLNSGVYGFVRRFAAQGGPKRG